MIPLKWPHRISGKLFIEVQTPLNAVFGLLADPQTWKENTRARNAYEYLTATEQLCANMGTFKFPFACYHGEVDTMTDPEGSKKLYAESQVCRGSYQLQLCSQHLSPRSVLLLTFACMWHAKPLFGQCQDIAQEHISYGLLPTCRLRTKS